MGIGIGIGIGTDITNANDFQFDKAYGRQT